MPLSGLNRAGRAVTVGGMTRVFGEVAATYHDVRPGYPPEVRAAIAEYGGGVPSSVVELGAGTGKATEVLAGFGVPYTAIEPDPRMAAVLRANFPQVEVVDATFEQWRPTGGAGLVVSAMAWHWMDPATRNRRAHDALAPGGTLAILCHTYGYADRALGDAIDAFLASIDPDVPARDRHWASADVLGSGVWPDATERVWHAYPIFEKARFLALMQTFSPFRRHAPAVRERTLAGLAELIGDGPVTLDLTTTMVLAGRPA
jgi:SAM-dependent methyltransferase